MAAISRQNRNTRKASRNMGNASFNVRSMICDFRSVSMAILDKVGRGLRSLVGYLRRAALPAVSRSTEFKSRAPLCFLVIDAGCRQVASLREVSHTGGLTPCSCAIFLPKLQEDLCAHLV